jgi:hypothetical protein
MWASLTRHTIEASMLLGMRMTFGDEATADMLFDNFDATSRESFDFARRHSNQLSTLLDAKYKARRDERYK